jgi:hypothetical protein
MRSPLLPAPFATVLWVVTLLTTQGPPTRTLAGALVEWPDPYTQVVGIRELGDGRVIVLDSRELRVEVVDFAGNRAEAVGRIGSGPGEYGYAARLVALPGDSSALYDRANQRVLLIGPNARPVGFLNTGMAGRSAGPDQVMMVARTGLTLASDAGGRLYSEGALYRTARTTRAEPRDSVAVERWDRASGKRDTVTYRRVPSDGRPTIVLGATVVRPVGAVAPPFSAEEQWAVANDGWIAVARTDPFRLDFFSPDGVVRRGREIAYERVKVTERHKELWRQRFREPVPEPSWPEVLPPFMTAALFFDPDGRLWVRRTTAADAPERFDVVDRRGNVVERVLLPEAVHLIGFGRSAVYAVRVTNDGLQYLQRYAARR